ncbi:MAG: hypothetical protein AB8D78_12650 [Akkermansiaceae bacterium]
MRTLLRYILILFGAVLPLVAQPDPNNERTKKPARAVWFACTSIPKDLENPIKVLAGEQITELELPRYLASDPVKIPEDGIIRIVREVPDLEDPKKTKYLVLAEAKISAGTKEALIILMPLPVPKGDLIFMTQVQSLANFKGGDRLFINLSKTPIRVKFGDSTVNVPARDANLFAAPDLAKSTNVPVRYEFFHAEHKKWRIITASTVVLRPTRREIHVFNDGSRIGKIKKHKILFPIEQGGR